MRKIKFLVASLLFCAMSYAGYVGYERVTMSEAERFMLANVEALTSGESSSGCYQTMGYCSNATGIVQMCTSKRTGEKCRIYVTGCRFC